MVVPGAITPLIGRDGRPAAAGRKHPGRRLRRHESNEIARRSSPTASASFRSAANFAAAKTDRPEGTNQRRPSAPINANPPAPLPPPPPPPTTTTMAIALTDRVADRRPTDGPVGFIKSANRPFRRTSQLPSSGRRPAGRRGAPWRPVVKGPSQPPSARSTPLYPPTPSPDPAPSCTPNMYISTMSLLSV